MIDNYTQEASEYIDDLVETDVANIWADIELLNAETDSDKWEAKFKNISKEYLMSSRFALMRILFNRATAHVGNGVELEKNSYSILAGQDLVTFRDISMEHAQKLSPEEHMSYMQYLLEIAGPSPEEDPDLYERIISRAWHDEESANLLMVYYLPEAIQTDPKQLKKHLTRIKKENKIRYGTRLTREEAFQLGHILKFTLKEAQWYLMRVFDVEYAGFRMNRSSDVIEAYCFLTDASCFKAEELKEKYREKTSEIEKRDDPERSRNWTRQTEGGLLENVESWKLRPDTMDEKFLSWLTDRAPGLDVPSRTACRVYRNLAAYAYAGDIPEETALLDELLHISDMDEESEEAEECLYNDGCISKEKCKRIADQLYFGNKTISDSKEDDEDDRIKEDEDLKKDNSMKAWSVITIRNNDKKLSVSSGVVNNNRIEVSTPETDDREENAKNITQSRIYSLLMGTSDVEKGDILYLLWYVFSLVWRGSKATDPNVIRRITGDRIFDIHDDAYERGVCKVIGNRVFDLKDAADALLSAAMLPSFYPPHLMEQGFLLAIIYASKTGNDPSFIYGSILQSLRDTRNREKGAKKRTLQEQIDIINHYRNANPRMTLKECALLYGVSEQSISRWQKELIEKGFIDTNCATE